VPNVGSPAHLIRSLFLFLVLVPSVVTPAEDGGACQKTASNLKAIRAWQEFGMRKVPHLELFLAIIIKVPPFLLLLLLGDFYFLVWVLVIIVWLRYILAVVVTFNGL
jgi:nitrate reductase NapE component